MMEWEWLGIALAILAVLIGIAAFTSAVKAHEVAKCLFVVVAIGMTVGYVGTTLGNTNFDSHRLWDWVNVGIIVLAGLYLMCGAWFYTLPREGRHRWVDVDEDVESTIDYQLALLPDMEYDK